MPTTEPTAGWSSGFGAAADLAAVVAGQGGVDGGRMSVVDAVVGRTDEGAAVHVPGEARQEFAELNAGNGGVRWA